MNYIGSKNKLLPFIFESIDNTLKSKNKELKDCVFCDMFAGTSVVGKGFKSKVKQVISNDKEFYSFVLAKNYIGNSYYIALLDWFIHILNMEPSIKGKIYEHYALDVNNRQYFSNTNAMKIDAIRIEIENWNKKKFISENEYYFLLASLLESADKVANTASTYGSYLKHLKKSAQKDLILEPARFTCTKQNNLVFNEDSNILIRKIKGDILYLDPPYNSREYGANYHILNTIAIYDDFIPKGKTGLRDYERSNWCKKTLVYDTLEDLIKNADFQFIFLSYNDEGLLSLDQIKEIFEKYGKYSCKSQVYQRFKTDTKKQYKRDNTVEYLHILEK